MASPDEEDTFNSANRPNSQSAHYHSQRRSVGDRQHDRAMSVFLPALVEIAAFTGFCLVRNLSAKGMMAVVYAQFAPDQPATVHFNGEISVPGRVAWSDSDRIGVEFEGDIDVDALLSELIAWQNAQKGERAPHLPIDCDGDVIVDDRLVKVRIVDISQHGVRVTGVHARVGDGIVVALPGMKPRKTLVHWTDSETMGLNFLIPFGLRELARWVIERTQPAR